VQEPAGWFNDIGFADAQHGWIVGYRNVYDELGNFVDDRGVLYGTSDGGVTWTEEWLSPYHFQHLLDVEVIDAQTAWVAGRSSGSGTGPVLMVTHDRGATWESRATDAVMGLDAVAFVDPLFGWAVGDGGEILHTEDAGETWSVQQTPQRDLTPWLVDVSFVDRQHGWAVGSMNGEGTGKLVYTTIGGN
jgi:photosystem II stability/assembly factor-like uncharacterized protein